MALVSVGKPYRVNDPKYSRAMDVVVWKDGYHFTAGQLCHRVSSTMLDFLPNPHYFKEDEGWERSFRSEANAVNWLRSRLVQRYAPRDEEDK